MEKIVVKQLTAQIEGKTILQDISFEVEAGQSLVIIGESGSGKTLLTKILIGQLPSSLSMQGEVHYGSMSLERNSLKDWQQLRGETSGLYVSKSDGYVQSFSDHSKSFLGNPAQP